MANLAKLVQDLGLDMPNAQRILGAAQRMMYKRLTEAPFTIGGRPYTLGQAPQGWRTEDEVAQRMAEYIQLDARLRSQKATKEQRNIALDQLYKKHGLK